MASVKEHLNKLREERIAREKARIEKLRELNLKKYVKNDVQYPLKTSISNTSVIRPVKSENLTKNNVLSTVKNNFHVNGVTKRPVTAPISNNRKLMPNKDSTANLKPRPSVHSVRTDKATGNKTEKTIVPMNNIEISKVSDKNDNAKTSVAKNYEKNTYTKDKLNVNKSISGAGNFKSTLKPKTQLLKVTEYKPMDFSRKSLQPTKLVQSATKANSNRQSVFERLYQPKQAPRKQLDDVEKLRTNPQYLQKVIKNAGLLLNKRHTVFEQKKTVQHPVRRSISAVHFKRISKGEINNCIHKWSSVGEKLNNLKEINEDEAVKQEVVSAIKSERKKVKFQTPVPFNFNTPRPDEMRDKLKNWLQKRGKSLDSFHHLQCFGIHHLSNNIKPLKLDNEKYDDENKENLPLDSDSDNDSFEDNMNNKDIHDKNNWRRASFLNDSAEFNDTQDTALTSEGTPHVDELLIGALNDLTELLREGFDWEQCARWLRAIRERFPSASDSAAYWECRAALEERRGDLQTSIECWEQAIAKGTERSIVEANLDQLLDKFMQLKISPNSGKKKQVDPKMIDVKNIFKSTIIRFAVQQAKLRQSNQSEPPKFTCTPVRRSARLSSHWSDKRTPLRVCTTVRQAGMLGHPLVFVPNDKLSGTP